MLRKVVVGTIVGGSAAILLSQPDKPDENRWLLGAGVVSVGLGTIAALATSGVALSSVQWRNQAFTSYNLSLRQSLNLCTKAKTVYPCEYKDSNPQQDQGSGSLFNKTLSPAFQARWLP